MSKQSNDSDKDRVYREVFKKMQRFRFNEQVASVFPDMINRSVPGYHAIIEAISLISALYARTGTNCYDLGCSLGASSLAIVQGLGGKRSPVIAVDNAPAMIRTFGQRLRKHPQQSVIYPVCADIGDVKIRNASLVVLNFTLQFLAPEKRDDLLRNIAAGMIPGGALVVSEKLRFEDISEQERLTEWHLAFKKAHGYSELEISQKRSALENVLISDSAAEHKQRLLEAGFSECWQWFQYFNFASFIAIK